MVQTSQTDHGHGMARHGTTRHGRARQGSARHGTARHGTARHGTTRHGTAQHNTAQARGRPHHRHSGHSPDALGAMRSRAARGPAIRRRLQTRDACRSSRWAGGPAGYPSWSYARASVWLVCGRGWSYSRASVCVCVDAVSDLIISTDVTWPDWGRDLCWEVAPAVLDGFVCRRVWCCRGPFVTLVRCRGRG